MRSQAQLLRGRTVRRLATVCAFVALGSVVALAGSARAQVGDGVLGTEAGDPVSTACPDGAVVTAAFDGVVTDAVFGWVVTTVKMWRAATAEPATPFAVASRYLRRVAVG
jgi:hypothetical protein